MAKGLQRLRRAAELGVDLSSYRLTRDGWKADGWIHLHRHCSNLTQGTGTPIEVNVLEVPEATLCGKCLDIGFGGDDRATAINYLAQHDLLLDRVETLEKNPTEIANAIDQIRREQQTLTWVKEKPGLEDATRDVARRSAEILTELETTATQETTRAQIRRTAIVTTLGSSKKRRTLPTSPEGLQGEHPDDEWEKIRRNAFGTWRKKALQGQTAPLEALERAAAAQGLSVTPETLRALVEHWEERVEATAPGEDVHVLLDRWQSRGADGPVKVAIVAYESARNQTGTILTPPRVVAEWITNRLAGSRHQILGTAEPTDTPAVLETLLALWSESDGVYRDGRAALHAAREVCR